ncbi:cytosine deaminase [candidate division MSBL1 archaeon SCGC-AAA382M17]|uniref:Cytosine deaminase n=1 Tax=candidate division MSBL1 archaeon SCGC-AAA382M17 TaxID=1698284 RepID=A0ABR5TK80_9EURY|nr:cytosine deaminase [candidate division MSBL1 archaeon SCGC-AAA382M17]
MDKFMKEAIKEAKKGRDEGGLPIGAVLVKNGKIIGRGHNKRVQEDDPVLHAEIDCFRNAGRLGSFKGTVLYSTLQPCYMCSGAAVQFGVKKVVVGESENYTGTEDFLESRGIQVVDLDLEECKRMMGDFVDSNPELWKEDTGDI